MTISILTRSGVAVAVICISLPVMAADATTVTMADGAVTLSGGVGVLALQADEIVYNAPGSSDEISHLFWESLAPMLTAGLSVDLPERWTLDVNAQVALAGDSYMEDYDWVGPDFVSYDANDWTHRSQHDDTNLDWYFNGSVLIGHDFQVQDNVTVNVNGGFKYTDVQWAAVGGTYVYSDTTVDNPGNNFRAYQGSFADGDPVITYRQQYPALIAGLEVEIVQDAWTFDLSAHAGMTFNAHTTDNHWMRYLKITDDVAMAPIVSVGAQAEYAVSDGMSVFLGGSLEKVFTARADAFYDYSPPSPYADFDYPDGQGAALMAASISAGVKGTF